jgi:hypothetical protein
MKKACLIVALLATPLAHGAYKCVDERGVTHIGDIPPAGCANVVMVEVTPSGNILRRIDPTPTPEQLKVREAEAEKRKEADRAAAEAKRKDMALLNTYSAEHEIDIARDRNIEPIRARIKSAQERIAALDARLKLLDEELEFYKAGKRSAKKGSTADVAPAMLVADQERAHKERGTLIANIASNEKEIVAVREHFEADKRRYAELKGNATLRAAVQAPSKDPTVAATMIPGAAGVAYCANKMYECQAGQQYICRSGTRSYPVNCVVERK